MNYALTVSSKCRQLVFPSPERRGLPFANRQEVRDFFTRQSANPSGARALASRLLRTATAARATEVAAFLLDIVRGCLAPLAYRPDVVPEGYETLQARLFREPVQEVRGAELVVAEFFDGQLPAWCGT